jgi:hypothetical protein
MTAGKSGSRWFNGGIVASVVIGASVFADLPCWKQGGEVPCPNCSNQTGQTCNGQPCNTTADPTWNIQSVTEVGAGESGRRGTTASYVGSCTRTVRTCVNNVCQEQVTYGVCHNLNPDELSQACPTSN